MSKAITEFQQAALFDVQEKIVETHELLNREKEFERRHQTLMEARLENAIRIGQNLRDFKTALPHGKFITFVETEFKIDRTTAWRFMSLAGQEEQEPNVATSQHLGWSIQSELHAAPATVIEMVETKQIAPTIAAIREAKREVIAQLKTKEVKLPTGKYNCLIVDPPWPMQKIEREVRPNQVEFDYPTMTEDELKAFPLPDYAADDCHLYLWTTQKYLPLALRLAEHWGFKYQCLLTWRKNVGFTPFSWMYSTEHVLFCTRGSLPLQRLGIRLDFEAKVREHSRKPDEFYDIVKQVSPEPRLDVFSREKREGFDQYGNEVEKYVSAR